MFVHRLYTRLYFSFYATSRSGEARKEKEGKGERERESQATDRVLVSGDDGRRGVDFTGDVRHDEVYVREGGWIHGWRTSERSSVKSRT